MDPGISMVNICYQGPGTTDNPRFLGCDVDPTPGSTGTGKGVVFYTGTDVAQGTCNSDADCATLEVAGVVATRDLITDESDPRGVAHILIRSWSYVCKLRSVH